MTKKIKGLILDRDGTLIEHVPYLSDPIEVKPLVGAGSALRVASDAGLLLFLHTNQSGIGRGYYRLDAVHDCNDTMISTLGFPSNPFAKICIAPETPDSVINYRKPSPRFAYEVMDEFGLASSELCYIGDCWSDLATACAARTQGIGVLTGTSDLEQELVENGLAGQFPICDNLSSAIELIVNEL